MYLAASNNNYLQHWQGRVYYQCLPTQTGDTIMEYITLTQLAVELGLDRSNMRKYVLKNGFSPVRVRTPESRAQLTLAVTKDEAEIIRALRQNEGYSNTVKPVNGANGHFYIIQVVPEFAPHRVKLGFASDTQARLDAHRTSAPTAKLIKSWPCKRSWEVCAITSVTRDGCTLVANEVYDCDDLKNLVKRGDDFFRIMPVI
jgi:hypothetical protein